MQDFFRQGGAVAVVVRAHAPAEGDTAVLTFGEAGSDPQLVLQARSPGSWGSRLVARVEGGRLIVSDTATGRTEAFSDLAVEVAESTLVWIVAASGGVLSDGQAATLTPATTDGDPPDAAAVVRGIEALRRADLVNLVVVPGRTEPEVVAAAVALAEQRRALCLLDAPPAWSSVQDAVVGAAAPDFTRSPNLALYFPRIVDPGPLRGPAGAVAGVFARTDVTRGVWKAPAGAEADLEGVAGLDVAVSDVDGGRLNPLGVNCLRTFPGTGPVVWGARTTSTDPEWRYVPVRRMALFLQESLARGLQWATFEPNDAALWDRIRSEADAFLDDLYRRGAFAGSTPRGAYFVTCEAAADGGAVDVTLGFAPQKPAEFVVLALRQAAGQEASVARSEQPEVVPDLGEGVE